MASLIRLLSAVFIALGLLGCCRIDQGAFLGEFFLQPGSANWFPFSAGHTLVFVSSDGQEDVLQYGPIERFFEDGVTGCIASDCATECDEYRSELMISQLKSTVFTAQIDLLLSKDFDLHSPEEPASQITDMLTLRLNGAYTCIHRGLPAFNPLQSLVLNGRSFSQVAVCELPIGQAETGQPSAIYYTLAQGVVGYRIGKDQIWRLK